MSHQAICLPLQNNSVRLCHHTGPHTLGPYEFINRPRWLKSPGCTWRTPGHPPQLRKIQGGTPKAKYLGRKAHAPHERPRKASSAPPCAATDCPGDKGTPRAAGILPTGDTPDPPVQPRTNVPYQRAVPRPKVRRSTKTQDPRQNCRAHYQYKHKGTGTPSTSGTTPNALPIPFPSYVFFWS